MLCALWLVDGTLSEDRYAGWERNSVRNSARRWARMPKAKVAIMGSSTSKDWLPSTHLQHLLGLKRGQILDAHINGCHQDCTYAEVRRMTQRRRHFSKVFYGTNLFQMCEQPHSKRVLQQTMMLPTEDIPRLFAIYAKAEQPLQLMARFIGMQVSGTYGDTLVAQHPLRNRLFGKGKRGQAWRWLQPKRPPRPPSANTCSYEDDAIAYKRALSVAMYADLATIADDVFIMMMPDINLGLPDHAERWAKHMALHRAMADAHPNVHLVDLTTSKIRGRGFFRDDIHLNKRGKPIQLKLFDQRMAELGFAKRAKARGARK